MTSNHDPVTAFVETAREFCQLIEGHRKGSRKSFLNRVAATLPRLYAGAVHLPRRNSSGRVKARRLSRKEWQALFMSLGRKLGRECCYWECFNPYVREELMAGSLADDFADIYRDIKPGLVSYDAGSTTSQEAAVTEWRSAMLSHWGHHATGALRVLHHLRSERQLPD
ncbi:MAG TPA: DUF5063 domain-containing protein [Planctomycetota bacterium]|jgi:hypothetical protein|nr:DUF5063 domain-containing protein [Planctomycetota bacterium]